MTFLPYQKGTNPAADAKIAALEVRVHQLESELYGAFVVLKVLEWSGTITNGCGDDRAVCPYCYGQMDHKGHREDCKLDAVIKAATAQGDAEKRMEEREPAIHEPFNPMMATALAIPSTRAWWASTLWRYGFNNEAFGLQTNGPYVLFGQVEKVLNDAVPPAEEIAELRRQVFSYESMVAEIERLDRAAAIEAMSEGEKQFCNYPNCNCPLDAPADPNWCARGLPHENAMREGGE